jgi:hypothetical protein
MMNGRFDPHFLELFADAQAQVGSPVSLPAFVLTPVLLALAVVALLLI